jgi:UDP-N-acetylmuramoyl-tripeptide--D-alanyl-D-alanine ligase
MRHLHNALPSQQATAHAADAEELAPLITEFVEPGDVIAVKGSFGSRMSVVVDALKELSRNAQSAVNGD